MKINEIKLLAIELEEWAMKDGRKGGWKKIVPQITAHHYGDLLDSLADIVDPSEYARRLHNNTQIIQRAFRNDTPNYRGQAAALAPAITTGSDGLSVIGGDKSDKKRIEEILQETWESADEWFFN